MSCWDEQCDIPLCKVLNVLDLQILLSLTLYLTTYHICEELTLCLAICRIYEELALFFPQCRICKDLTLLFPECWICKDLTLLFPECRICKELILCLAICCIFSLFYAAFVRRGINTCLAVGFNCEELTLCLNICCFCEIEEYIYTPFTYECTVQVYKWYFLSISNIHVGTIENLFV